jgi:hypothetical protein
MISLVKQLSSQLGGVDVEAKLFEVRKINAAITSM